MRFYKIFSIISGIALIIVLTVGITIGVQKTIHKKSFEKRMPQLAGVFGKEKPKDLLDTIRIVRAIDELSISEEQTGRFVSLLRKQNELRRSHRKERNKRIEELEKLLKEKASPGDLEKIVTELEQLEDKFKSESDSLKTELDNLLTIEQQAKYILFEHEFQHEMRRLVGKGPKMKRGQRHFKKEGADRFRGTPSKPKEQIEEVMG